MEPLEKITAAILAGGLGTRLRSVVTDRSKVVASVSGKPFISFILDKIEAAGIRRAVLLTGHLGENVEELLGSHHGKVELVYSQESTPMGTAGAVRLGLPLYNSDPVMVFNGDSFCNADLGSFWQQHQRAQSPASLVVRRVEDPARYGQVRLDATGLVERFDEKSSQTTGPGWINAGIYLLSRGVLEQIPEDRASSLETDVFPRLTEGQLTATRSEAEFIDIGLPETYGQAEAFFESLGS